MSSTQRLRIDCAGGRKVEELTHRALPAGCCRDIFVEFFDEHPQAKLLNLVTRERLFL